MTVVLVCTAYLIITLNKNLIFQFLYQLNFIIMRNINDSQYISLIPQKNIQRPVNRIHQKNDSQFHRFDQIIKIKYNQKNLNDRLKKKQYIYKILKNTNPLVKTIPKISINQLILNQLEQFKSYKQQQNSKNTSQLNILIKQMQKLKLQIQKQRQINNKYQQKINEYFIKIEERFRSKLNKCQRQRIQQQVQFCKRVDANIQSMKVRSRLSMKEEGQTMKDSKIHLQEQLLDKNSQLNSCESTHTAKLIQKFNNLKDRFNINRMKLQDNFKKLSTSLQSKIRHSKQEFAQMKINLKKLDSLLNEIVTFQKQIILNMNYLKQSRISQENNFILIIEKIIDGLSDYC